MAPLCDAGCTVTFDRSNVTIRYGTQLVAQGTRTSDGLWHISFPSTQQPQEYLNLSTLANKTAGDRIAFLHAAAGYPVLSTWIRAIRQGFYATWPGLTPAAVKRHLPKSIITDMGHMNQQRKNQRSTKVKPSKPRANHLQSSSLFSQLTLTMLIDTHPKSLRTPQADPTTSLLPASQSQAKSTVTSLADLSLHHLVATTIY
jgi:hypothetical protein